MEGCLKLLLMFLKSTFPAAPESCISYFNMIYVNIHIFIFNKIIVNLIVILFLFSKDGLTHMKQINRKYSYGRFIKYYINEREHFIHLKKLYTCMKK